MPLLLPTRKRLAEVQRESQEAAEAFPAERTTKPNPVPEDDFFVALSPDQVKCNVCLALIVNKKPEKEEHLEDGHQGVVRR